MAVMLLVLQEGRTHLENLVASNSSVPWVLLPEVPAEERALLRIYLILWGYVIAVDFYCSPDIRRRCPCRLIFLSRLLTALLVLLQLKDSMSSYPYHIRSMIPLGGWLPFPEERMITLSVQCLKVLLPVEWFSDRMKLMKFYLSNALRFHSRNVGSILKVVFPVMTWHQNFHLANTVSLSSWAFLYSFSG